MAGGGDGLRVTAQGANVTGHAVHTNTKPVHMLQMEASLLNNLQEN